MDVQQTTFSLQACQNIQLPNTKVEKCPSKFLFGRDMFTFDTCLHFTHKYKNVNVQKLTFIFKST